MFFIHRFLVSDFHNPINKLPAFIASGDAKTQNHRIEENPMVCFNPSSLSFSLYFYLLTTVS